MRKNAMGKFARAALATAVIAVMAVLPVVNASSADAASTRCYIGFGSHSAAAFCESAVARPFQLYLSCFNTRGGISEWFVGRVVERGDTGFAAFSVANCGLGTPYWAHVTLLERNHGDGRFAYEESG